MSRESTSKIVVAAYAGLAYLLFAVTFAYFIGFVLNFGVTKTIDSGSTSPIWLAILVDTFLVALFGLQHSVMARERFKQWLTRYIPKPIERSTYVLISSLLLAFMIHFWMPIPLVLWQFEHPFLQSAIYGFMLFGWLLVAYASVLINHFELFGLRQAILYLQSRSYQPLRFKSEALYRIVRHPILLGTLIAFWATPFMTIGHLLFALLMTGYATIGTKFEEQDLVQLHSPDYRSYQKKVPMFIPRLGWGRLAGPLHTSQHHLKDLLSRVFR